MGVERGVSMKATISKLENFVQGDLALTNREALNLIREFRVNMERESKVRKRENKLQEQALSKIMEELARG